MGALSNLQTIHIATHDSFAEGQNGPTHQPVELDSLYRAMPNLQLVRPCDGEELVGAWKIALEFRHMPSMLCLARDYIGYVPGTSRSGVSNGAYVIVEPEDRARLTFVSCGTNLHYVVEAAKSLTLEGCPVRVVSAPTLSLFDQQEDSYKDKVFPRDGRPIISVEEYVPQAWAKYVTASIGMKGYGFSASSRSNYQRFCLDKEGILKHTRSYLDWLGSCDARSMGWRWLC